MSHSSMTKYDNICEKYWVKRRVLVLCEETMEVAAMFSLNTPVKGLSYALLTKRVVKAILGGWLVCSVCFRAENNLCSVGREMCRT